MKPEFGKAGFENKNRLPVREGGEEGEGEGEEGEDNTRDRSVPIWPAFRDFFGVRLTLEYDFMCWEADFTQEKNNFHPTKKSPFLLTACCCSVTKLR